MSILSVGGNGKGEAFRNDVITKIAEKGVSSNVHYKPLSVYSAYKNLGFEMEDYLNV